jgi:SAM-dependent methyltransferase
MSPSTALQDRLTEREFWDSQYDPAAASAAPRPPSRTKAFLRRVLGPKVRDMVQDYREYLVWNVVYPKYLSGREGAKVLEVGSAPGTHLVQLHKAYGFDCYGVEYTPRGADLNRQVFRRHGLDPANVIQADFFSSEFQAQYRGQFDIVLSRGFIEHFRDVDGVVSAHLNLLAPGGLLIVTIPNLRGINYGLALLFCKERLPLHNLAIMKRERFARLFDLKGLSSLYCDYFGGVNLPIVDTSTTRLRRLGLAMCAKAQLLVNLAYRLLPTDSGAGHPWFSSHLVFLGRKER